MMNMAPTYNKQFEVFPITNIIMVGPMLTILDAQTKGISSMMFNNFLGPSF